MFRFAAVTDNVGTEIQFHTRPAAGSLTQSMTLDSTGRLGIGTTSPGNFNQVVNAPHLVVGGGTTSSPGLTLYSTTSGAPIIAFADGTVGNQQYRGYLQYDHSNDALISSASSYQRFDIAGSEGMRLDSSKRLLVGTSSSSGDPLFVVHGRVGSATEPGTMALSRGGTIIADYNLGQLDFTDGSNNVGARILGTAETGWGGSGDAPGRLTFSTTADGASSPTERLRITSAGLVGIGTSSPRVNVHIFGTASNAPTLGVASGSLIVGPGDRDYGLAMGTAAAGYSWIQSQNFISPGAAYSLLLQPSGGNVGIGTTTVNNGVLHVKSNGIGSQAGLAVEASANDSFLSITNNGSAHKLEASYNSTGSYQPISFVINGEKARIDTSGRLLVGTSSALINESQIGATGAGNTACLKTTVSSNNPLLLWNSATSGDNIFCSFFTEASYTVRATIDYNRGAGQVRYNTTSDQRLKSDIVPAPTALSKLSEIEVKSYKWTETDYLVEYGFIAQELNVVLPDAVKQGDNGDEVVDAWAVDNSKLVPLLTKALQEAVAKIESLESRLTAAGI
jgi:hypothetical protein